MISELTFMFHEQNYQIRKKFLWSARILLTELLIKIEITQLLYMCCHLHNRFISIKMKEDSKLTNMTYYLKLMRIKHYIKNLLIFFPLVFSRSLFTHNFFTVMIAAIAFSLLSSAV